MDRYNCQYLNLSPCHLLVLPLHLQPHLLVQHPLQHHQRHLQQPKSLKVCLDLPESRTDITKYLNHYQSCRKQMFSSFYLVPSFFACNEFQISIHVWIFVNNQFLIFTNDRDWYILQKQNIRLVLAENVSNTISFMRNDAAGWKAWKLLPCLLSLLRLVRYHVMLVIRAQLRILGHNLPAHLCFSPNTSWQTGNELQWTLLCSHKSWLMGIPTIATL